MIIRAKTFNRWMQANFPLSLCQKMARYGLDYGWYGFADETHTSKLYTRFKEEIWEMIVKDAKYFNKSPLEHLAWTDVRAEVQTAAHLENMLIRYAAERIVEDLT